MPVSSTVYGGLQSTTFSVRAAVEAGGGGFAVARAAAGVVVAVDGGVAGGEAAPVAGAVAGGLAATIALAVGQVPRRRRDLEWQALDTPRRPPSLDRRDSLGALREALRRGLLDPLPDVRRRRGSYGSLQRARHFARGRVALRRIAVEPTK